MEIYELVKPATVSNEVIIQKLEKYIDELPSYIEKANSPQYLFWDKIRYLPRPKGITAEEFWGIIKLLRSSIFVSREKTPIKDIHGNHFTWQHLPDMSSFLHEVDMQLGGIIETDIININDQTARQKFISRGIMEEAIASSQLEGAHTTRKVAKRILLEKRKPRNKSEQMIINNYQAMLYVEDDLKNQELSLELLLRLHSIITEGILKPDDIGRFRRNKDRIMVNDPVTNIIYHIPPPENFLIKSLERFLQYANDKLDKGIFVHPLIKAIILHFWVGYLHPFVDGNGRIARIIFYWYLLRKGYWAFSYLPISRIIRKSPVQYREAYTYSEQDDNDLTYFIDYNIRKIRQAMREFEEYCNRKVQENSKMARITQSKYNFNERQIQLLRYLYKNPSATTSIRTHSQVYNITRITARKDLEKLEQEGFLTSQKVGRERPFKGTDKVHKLFA